MTINIKTLGVFERNYSNFRVLVNRRGQIFEFTVYLTRNGVSFKTFAYCLGNSANSSTLRKI